MTLAEKFAEAKGGPIVHEGQTLHWTYWLPVSKGQAIEVTFLSATSRPLQGVGVIIEGGELEVASIKSKQFALWSDTAPEHIMLRVARAKDSARVGFFNQWRDEVHGSTMYRINDAAIRVDHRPDGAAILHCSDGRGELNLTDMVVQLRVL